MQQHETKSMNETVAKAWKGHRVTISIQFCECHTYVFVVGLDYIWKWRHIKETKKKNSVSGCCYSGWDIFPLQLALGFAPGFPEPRMPPGCTQMPKPPPFNTAASSSFEMKPFLVTRCTVCLQSYALINGSLVIICFCRIMAACTASIRMVSFHHAPFNSSEEHLILIRQILDGVSLELLCSPPKTEKNNWKQRIKTLFKKAQL